MNEDPELLKRYASDGDEAAFSEFARKNVDLVYSAALRLMNGGTAAAEDVTQQVFVEAARQARRLAKHPVVVGWLYTTTRFLALRANRAEHRRKAREQEATLMHEHHHDDSALDWERLGSLIEEAMHELDEPDRLALLLRYFQNKPLSEVGGALNLTENAARMRVDRAAAKLRGKLASRGVNAAAPAIAAALAANAVQAAPAGFAASLASTALAAAAAHTSAFAVLTQAFAMNTIQKAIIISAVAVATGAGVYSAREHSRANERIVQARAEQGPLQAEIRALKQERDNAAVEAAALRQENERLRSAQSATEVLRLRGQVGALRQQAAANAASADAGGSGFAKMMSDPAMKELIHQAQRDKLKGMFADLFKELHLTAEQTDAVLNALGEHTALELDRLASNSKREPGQWPARDASNLEQALKAVVGEAGFRRFQSYSQEIPARTTIALLRDELTEHPLNNEQSMRLLEVIKAEPNELTQGITGAPDSAFLGSEDDINRFLAKVAESNERITAQAAGFLNDAQLATLGRMLSKSIDARRVQGAAFFQKSGRPASAQP